MAVALDTSPEAFLSGPEDRGTDPEAQAGGSEEKPSAEGPAQSDGGEEKPSAEGPAHADGGEEKPSAEAPAHSEEEKPSAEAAVDKRPAEKSARQPSAGTTGAVIALVAGLIAAALALSSPISDYRVPLLLGIAALVVGAVAWRRSVGSRRALAITGTLLGAVALAAGIRGAVMVETTFSGLLDFEKDPASKKRERFCSKKGDKLDRLSSPATDSARELRRQTRDALKAARRAPDNAECAVGALNSIARTWNQSARSAGYGDAKMQVKRIRRFQRRNGLRESKF
jgi:hypothetical protein